MSVRRVVKRCLPYAAMLSAYHRVRNRNTLTIVAFHRVLPESDPRSAGALAEWTISDRLLETCIAFFKNHYNIVSLQDLLASLDGGEPLPSRALLITFDDGYADNAEYALGVLQRYTTPAVIFVASSLVECSHRPWGEDLLAAFERREVSETEIASLHDAIFGAATAPVAVQAKLGNLVRRTGEVPFSRISDAERQLARRLSRLDSPRQMLTSQQLASMHSAGISIGAHGRTHTALTSASDLRSELEGPRRELAALLSTSADHITALSFPFGDNSPVIVERAFEAGYEILFNLEGGLNSLSGSRLSTRVLNRVHVSGPTLTRHGDPGPEELARYFFLVPIVPLKDSAKTL